MSWEVTYFSLGIALWLRRLAIFLLRVKKDLISFDINAIYSRQYKEILINVIFSLLNGVACFGAFYYAKFKYLWLAFGVFHILFGSLVAIYIGYKINKGEKATVKVKETAQSRLNVLSYRLVGFTLLLFMLLLWLYSWENIFV